MTPRRFGWALRTRGPALDTWPGPERDAALALLGHDPAARQALADALADTAAAEDDLPPTPAECAALRRMQAVIRHALAPSPPLLRGLGLGAMAACLAAGLYLGTPATSPDTAAAPMTEATVLAALEP